MNDAFGVWLKCALVEAGMKQRDFAKVMGTSDVSVSRWIRGKRFPTQKQIARILEYFNSHIEIVPNELPKLCRRRESE